VVGKDGTPLSGDMAARVLDIAGLVVNANTIPGDKSSARASGIRLGTPWITQRGLVESDVKAMGDIIADILFAMEPYQATGGSKPTTRAKIDFLKLENAKLRVRDLVNKALSSDSRISSGYPYFHFLDSFNHLDKEKWVTFEISGEKLPQIMNYTVEIETEDVLIGEVYHTRLFVYDQFTDIRIKKQDEKHVLISCPSNQAGMTAAWLRSLSDGYIRFDDDLMKRIPGPFFVRETDKQITGDEIQDNPDNFKPYFLGISGSKGIRKNANLPEFKWEEKESKENKKTMLNAWHVEQNAKIIPFAGWEMPVWYSSVLEEHRATREKAGLFDVTHMGVFEASGSHALSFLDCVCGNDISSLEVGQSCYTHFLLPNADVVDDLLVYRHNSDKYLLVVNAANEEKDWAWLNAVKNKSVKVDEQRPWAHSFGTDVDLRNLKDEKEGDRMRVDIALQGPLSNQVLNSLGFSKEDLVRILALKRTDLCHAVWQGTDLIISRTGYTGEKLSYEIFIHPEKAMDLWNEIIIAGEPFGLKPCGLGARDSLRTEAGLPLYGHEMAGVMNLGVADAGFGSFVKTYKPWFIGRETFIQAEKDRKSEVIRFRFEQQRVRLAHYGDPVFNDKGRKIGSVTSCAIDKEGFINGQAYIEMDQSSEGTELYIYQNAASLNEFTIQEIEHGGRVQLPSKAIVISRFPKL
jgi:glycine hydroxymethyltransferase